MFEIKKSEEVEYCYDIYFNGKKLGEASYEEEENVIFLEDYPRFDMDEIADMMLKEFPDNFSFNMESVRNYAKVFSLLYLGRKGEKISFSMSGYLFTDDVEGNQLLWNPRLYADTAGRIADKKNASLVSENRFEDHPVPLDFEFTFPATGTVGSMLKKSVELCEQIMHETELILLNKAQKKLMR
ncbi:MAG: hypothetical protein ABIT08_08860 [Bacteroidia bacterium]